MALPTGERAASSAWTRSSILRALATSSGKLVTSSCAGRRRAARAATVRVPPPPCRATAAAASAAASKPALGQVGGVGVAGGLAHDDPDPGAAVASRRQLLDPAVVEHGGGRLAVLDEHLGEVAPAAERGAEHALDDGGLDEQCLSPEPASLTGSLLSRSRSLPAPGPMAGRHAISGPADLPSRRRAVDPAIRSRRPPAVWPAAPVFRIVPP